MNEQATPAAGNGGTSLTKRYSENAAGVRPAPRLARVSRRRAPLSPIDQPNLLSQNKEVLRAEKAAFAAVCLL